MGKGFITAAFTYLFRMIGIEATSDIEWYHFVWFIAIVIFAVVVFRLVAKHVGNPLDEDDDSDYSDQQEDAKSDLSNSENSVKTINVSAKPMNTGHNYDGMNNAVLIRAILGDLSCQYDENEDGTIFFVYQGERFWVSASENSVWIRIIDMRWYDCSLDKLEEMSCMQKAINTANSRQACTALYAISKEDNEMIAYSKCDLIITSDFPAPDQYFAAWLANFFRLKQEVVIEFEKEKQKIGLSEN